MLNKKLGLIAVLVGVAANGIFAASPSTLTNYAVGDVLVCFRSGSVDMVVDAGPISTFTSASGNQRISINQYTGSQLGNVGTNGVSWSAFAWGSDNTLYVTSPRLNPLNVPTPWIRASPSTQSGTVGRMVTIPPGALDEYNLSVYPASTPAAVIEEDVSSGNPNYTDGASYHDAIAGAYGSKFDGKFQGNPENTTSNNFTTAGAVIRSDFYQLTPTFGYNQRGTWLGYFELNTNGVMTYVAYPTTTPSIVSISHTNTTATISYVSGLYGTYTLRGTNNISAPISTWPPIGGSLSSGDTLTHTVTDTDTASNKFYIIKGQ